MRYIQRNDEGKCVGHYANPQPYAQELVADNHPDIVEWNERRVIRKPDKTAALEARIAELEKKLMKP